MSPSSASASRPSAKASLRTKLLAAFLGLLAAAYLAEVLTRWLVPDPAFQFENVPEFFVADADVGYRNRPNFDGYAQGYIRVQTNQLRKWKRLNLAVIQG